VSDINDEVSAIVHQSEGSVHLYVATITGGLRFGVSRLRVFSDARASTNVFAVRFRVLWTFTKQFDQKLGPWLFTSILEDFWIYEVAWMP